MCLKKYLKQKKNKPFFSTKYTKNIIKMKYHQFTSKTEPALNDPLWLICRKTKKKQNVNVPVHAEEGGLNMSCHVYWDIVHSNLDSTSSYVFWLKPPVPW